MRAISVELEDEDPKSEDSNGDIAIAMLNYGGRYGRGFY